MDANGYNPSILQSDLTHCFRCNGRHRKLDRHEIFGGANRAKSKRLGLWVMLCHEECHLNGVHKHPDEMRELREIGQRQAMVTYGWTVDDFRREFGKNYI